MTHLPHHMAITALLEKGQFDACRLMAQEFIAQQLAIPQPDDLELAYLYLVLCRALLGVHEYELAAEKADVAVFLAMKSKDDVLLEEARYRAGTSYGRAADYRTAIRRFTDCLTHTGGKLQAEAYFGRGLAYDVLGAYSYASADYQSAIQLLSPDKTQLGRKARLNLAWVLILQRKFADAEALLAQLENAIGAEDDRLLQAQIAHDRIHMGHLKGENKNAFVQAVAVLGRLDQGYPHVRAHVAVTLLSMAADKNLAQHAFTFGVLAKRLAGSANRPDLDEEVSKAILQLQCQTGTDGLVQSLSGMRQVLPGALQGRRASKRRHSGGVS